MSRPLLVASRLLQNARAQWADDYEIITPESLDVARAADIEVIVSDGESLDSSLVARLPNLKLVACFSTGYAGIDLALLRSRGVTLTTAAGVNAHDVADHAIALMLAWWHRIPTADRNVRAGVWRDALKPRPSLRGKRLGIVGLGRIGTHVASRAAALGMQVSWWGPHEKPAAPYSRAPTLNELARDSDVLVVAMRATADNTDVIDSEVLANLGSKGLLVNVSRGFLVDQAALLQALECRSIAGAALDVFSAEPVDASQWAQLDNVVLTPHIAGYTQEAGSAMFGQLRENIRRYFAGEPLLTPVAAH